MSLLRLISLLLSSTQSNRSPSHLSQSFSFMNSQPLYTDECVFHYPPGCLHPPRPLHRFLQHIEKLVHKSLVYRANRKDYTVSGKKCKERKTNERKIGNLCIFFCQGVPVLFVESPKEAKKKREDVFTTFFFYKKQTVSCFG